MLVAARIKNPIQAFLKRNIEGSPFPLSGTIELGWRCNFDCVHCYLKERRNLRIKNFSFEQYAKLFGQMAASGTLGLSFTGGEPLLRPDFPSIWKAAFERGFLLSLQTNASLIDAKTADFLENHPPRAVEISLYGCDEKTYREITGTRGAFSKVLRAAELLRKRNITIVLKTVLLKPLVEQSEKLRALARSFGAEIAYDPVVHQTLGADSSPCELRSPPELAVAAELSSSRRLREIAAYHRLSKKFSGASMACGAGRTSFNIDPGGQLQPCLMIRRPALSLVRSDFAAAWQRLSRNTYGVLPVRPCAECSNSHLCTYCPGLALLKTRPQDDRFYCLIAEKRRGMIRGAR
jgi:radical SAM protein with 4Fe4S-binding SPASM domain